MKALPIAAFAVTAGLLAGCSSDEPAPEPAPVVTTADAETAAQDVADTYVDFLNQIREIPGDEALAVLEDAQANPDSATDEQWLARVNELAPQAYEMVDFTGADTFDQGYFYGMTLGLAGYVPAEVEVTFSVDPDDVTVDGDRATLDPYDLDIEMDGTPMERDETQDPPPIEFVLDGEWKIVAESVRTL